MPITTVHVPEGSFDAASRACVVDALTEAVARAEGIPDDPVRRSGIVVIWSELSPGSIHSNRRVVDELAVPVFVRIEPPAGVLDKPRAERLVADVDAAFRLSYTGALPMFTSVIVRHVADGA